MEESYNLFVFVERNHVVAVGGVPHTLDGTDVARIAELQSLVSEDLTRVPRQQIPPITWERYATMQRVGTELELFEDFFLQHRSPTEPLVVITLVVDGIPKHELVAPCGPLDMEQLLKSELGPTAEMIDYLRHYTSESGFDLPQLMNDDYFKAIKLLFNGSCFVSAAKLLMSCIDSIAYVEFGDAQRNFQNWLATYTDIQSLGISEDELWEFRNSVLHMSNLSSRKVLAGTVDKLILCVGPPHNVPAEPRTKYFSFMGLVNVVADGISRWSATYNTDLQKRITFVERYDMTISDSRLLRVNLVPE